MWALGRKKKQLPSSSSVGAEWLRLQPFWGVLSEQDLFGEIYVLPRASQQMIHLFLNYEDLFLR